MSDEIVPTTDGSTPRSRSRVVVAIVIVLLAVIAVALLISKCGSSSKHSSSESSASDKQTIPVVSLLIRSTQADGRPNPVGLDFTTTGSSCTGAGSLAKVTAGAPVIIQDSAGAEVGRTTLAPGAVVERGCQFSTVGPLKVAPADAYVIVFAGAPGTQPYTLAQLEQQVGKPLFDVGSG